MIITGDIASPSQEHSQQLLEVFERHPDIFQNKSLVCNFEGLIYETHVNVKEPVLYNHPSVVKTLIERGPLIAALANNHTLDLPSQFVETIKKLEASRVLFAGAGKSKEAAEAPAVFFDKGKEVILLNACWDFLLYNQKNPTEGIFVAEINEGNLIETVVRSKQESPGAAILVFLHWNFDMESLPFPMHRQFSMALIDAGADIVIGTHAHCVQGGEKYRDGYIVYGLGNFFMPHGVYASGRLSFPPQANTELVFEYDFINNRATCHWFEYQRDGFNHTLAFLGSDVFETSERMKSFSPFRGMGSKEYLKYFKKFRRKRFMIPVFKDYRQSKLNALYTLGLECRAKIAHFLAMKGVIKWQN